MINALYSLICLTRNTLVFKMMLGGDIKLKSTPKTIYNQKSALLKKLHLKNQSELIHIFGGMRFD